MATANKVEEIVVKGVTLELSLEEAETLASALSMVGGSVYTTRRQHTNEIENALREAGIETFVYDLTGELRFNQNKLPLGEAW